MSSKYARNRRIVMRSKEPPEVRFALLHSVEHPFRCPDTLNLEGVYARMEAVDRLSTTPAA